MLSISREHSMVRYDLPRKIKLGNRLMNDC